MKRPMAVLRLVLVSPCSYPKPQDVSKSAGKVTKSKLPDATELLATTQRIG